MKRECGVCGVSFDHRGNVTCSPACAETARVTGRAIGRLHQKLASDGVAPSPAPKRVRPGRLTLVCANEACGETFTRMASQLHCPVTDVTCSKPCFRARGRSRSAPRRPFVKPPPHRPIAVEPATPLAPPVLAIATFNNEDRPIGDLS